MTPQPWPERPAASESFQRLLASAVRPKAGQAQNLVMPAWNSSFLMFRVDNSSFYSVENSKLTLVYDVQRLARMEIWGGPRTWRVKKRMQIVLICRECWGVQRLVGTPDECLWSKAHGCTATRSHRGLCSGTGWIAVTGSAGIYPSRYPTWWNAPWCDGSRSAWRTRSWLLHGCRHMRARVGARVSICPAPEADLSPC